MGLLDLPPLGVDLPNLGGTPKNRVNDFMRTAGDANKVLNGNLSPLVRELLLRTRFKNRVKSGMLDVYLNVKKPQLGITWKF